MLVLIFLFVRMYFPPKIKEGDETDIESDKRISAGVFSFLIGVFAGFLGVGPGFLLMPTLVVLGYTARIATATNAVVVTLPSFSAFIAHLPTAKFDLPLVIASSIASILGAQMGALFMAKRVKSLLLARIFAIVLLGLAIYRLILLI